jgi:deoxyribonuclease V
MFDYKKAAKTQKVLSRRLSLSWTSSEVKRIAGADCSYDYHNQKVGAKVVVCRFPDLEIIDSTDAVEDLVIPYVPGYLNFREAPAYIKAFKKLKKIPDVTLIDGNGVAHPRKMGIASYLGVVLDTPTIGCAKSPFFSFMDPDEHRGACTFYRNKRNEKVGYCLRTRSGVKPIFVSPGHLIDLETSRKLVLGCSRYRIPEPIRYAHKQAGALFQ